MSVDLSQILSEEEVTQLSEDVKSKVGKELMLKESALDSLKSELDKLKGDYEQKCYEMDKTIIDISAKLDIETTNCVRATEKQKELDSNLKSSRERIESLESMYATSQAEFVALKHSQDVWKDERLSMQHLMERKELELKELKEGWRSVSDKLSVAVVGKNELELKLDELQNSGIATQYNSKRLEQEKESLTQQNAMLSEELNLKVAELNKIKMNTDNEMVTLRVQMEVKTNEIKQLSDINKNLRDSNSNLEKKVGDLLEKMNAADQERQSMEELYRNELQSMTNLAELYKASAKDEEEKAKELLSAVQELQKLVNNAAETQQNTEREVEGWKGKAQEMANEIEMQKKELEKANDLLTAHKKQGPQNLSEEELASLCPTAAMASKFIRSGMTLTEIYTKYVETLDDLEISKHENKRLSDTMDDILHELQEKAPILKQQKEDYERALATVTQLTAQMDSAAIDCQKMKAEADDALRRLGKVARDKKRLESETRDLSTQVKYLLKELEESRGQRVLMDSNDEADPNVSSSSEVISEHLVTFRNIDELQEQNRRLLGVVRELGEESEKRERETHSDEVKRLTDTLDQAKDELEHLREERAKQLTYVEAIVRQRDMYRVLLSQEPKGAIPFSVIGSPSLLTPSKGSGDTSGSQGNSDGETKALQILKQEYDEYKKETIENTKVANEQTDNLRTQISNVRADNAKLKANVDFTNEKYDLLKETFENVRKECDMIREKNTKLLVIVQKHELNYSRISNDLMVVQQQKSGLQTKIENLSSEIEILRRAEQHVRAENASLQRDQRGQSVLLSNLQKIQQSMEKEDLEVRSELRSRIDALNREIETLRKTGNESLQQKQSSLQMVEKQLLKSQQSLENVRAEKESLVTKSQELHKELEELKIQNQSHVSKVALLEERISRSGHGVEISPDDATVQALKDAKEQVRSLQDENAALKTRCEREQRSAQQHKDCAAAVEESLKQSNEANRELSEALEAKLKSASEHQIKLEQRITVLEEENRELNSKKTSLLGEVDRRTSDLKRQVTSLQEELNMLIQKEKELRRSEQEARNQYREQAHLIADAQNKYQREMLLHAESVKQLMELKESSRLEDEKASALKSEAEQAKHLLDSSKGMWEKQRMNLEKENEELKERNSDLNGQVHALHTELENLSTQMVAQQQKRESDSVEKLNVSGPAAEDPSGKSHEQLMDIVRYLRKQKNLYEVKFEVAETESNRLKQQMAHLQKQADEAKKALRDERHKSQTTSVELAKHEALMKKVESLNVLTDSNRMLRAENEKFQAELKVLKSELEETKQKLEPLHTENTQLGTQKDTLEAEKKALEQDVRRWQQRSQQLLQSPKRQDPEEYRKLMGDKQRLTRNVEQLNKDVTEKKLEISNLQGEIRNLTQQGEALKLENANNGKKIEKMTADATAKQAEVNEKTKTIAQIRKVGRRYKSQYEELKNKLETIEAKQQAPGEETASDAALKEQVNASEAAKAELNAKVSALEASMTKLAKEKEEMQARLSVTTAENNALKSQVEQAVKKSEEESKAGASNNAQEVRKLTTERDDMKKQLQEKDDKSKRLLTLAKTRIEQVRREKDELVSERDQLKGEANNLKESVENLKQAVKKESDQKSELMAKVEELQKQVSAAGTQQQQQNKVSTVVGHQIHAGPGGGSSVELRKAVNIRPMSTQRVSQVSPMRVTRTARVMPEPQQDAQEGSSSDVVSSRPATHTPSSSHHSSTLAGAGPSAGSVTRAFVHPMTPSSARHPPVVSSTPISSSTPSTSSNADPSQADASVSRGGPTRMSSSTDVVQAASSSVVTVAPAEEVSESDLAIVSSSDDQTSQADDSLPSPASSATGKSGPGDSEDVPTQSATSSGDASVSRSSIPVVLSRQAQTAQKRTYDDVVETNLAPDETPASSSDAQIDVPPISKRQRSAPDQSSAAVVLLSVETPESNNAPATQSSEAGSSSESQLHAADTQSTLPRHDDAVGTSSVGAGSVNQSVPTSSGAEEVIVLSSDDEGSRSEYPNMEQDQPEIFEAVEGQEMGDSGEAIVMEPIPQNPYVQSRPVLAPLHPTDIVRTRTMTRPAPLTPGLVPAVADDGDGIVPCTPTLPTRRHDDYQAINSPHVPAGSVPIRFRFEDVPSQSLQPQSGICSVDNTIMDFSDAARSVPTTPVAPAAVTSVTHVALEQAQSGQPDSAAVSSSIMEEDAEEEDDTGSGDMNVPTGPASEVPTGSGATQSETQGAVSYLQSTKGRRIKLIGGRSRGKGGTSPSTSNQ